MITDEELLCAKKTFADISRSITDSVTAMERWIIDKVVSGEDRLPKDVNEAVEALKVEDVARVAASVRLDTVFRLIGKQEEETGDAV